MERDDPKMQSLVLSVAMDQSVGVKQSITGLQIAALLGAGLAGIVVFLFLRSFASTLVIVLAIPLALLAAFSGMFLSNQLFGGGTTINSMTLGGLALAIGILIDQSIVVLENIVRHQRMGKKPGQAALDGTREVLLPVLVATITFVVVFFPVVFLSGMARFLFTPLAVAASLAIAASFVLSITLIPAYCAWFLRVKPDSSVTGHPSESSGGRLGALYGRLLGGVLKARWGVALASLVLFAGAVGLLLTLGQELFPPVDSGQFTIYARMPSGTRIEITEDTVAQIEQVIVDELGEPDPAYAIGQEQQPQSSLQILISNIGVLMDWPAAYTPNTGAMDAFLLVQLKGRLGDPGAFETVVRMREKLNRMFPEVEFAFDTGGMMTAALNMGEPSPIHFQITGSNLETAQDIAQIIKREAEGAPGAADVRIAQRMDYPTLNVTMDRVLAKYQGVTPENVMKNLVSATNSSINFDPAFWIDHRNGNHYFMGVQYREEAIDSPDTLLDIPITGAGSERPVRLRNVAIVEQSTGPAVINHHNITRATDVYANVLPGYDVGSVVTQIERRLESDPELLPIAGSSERGNNYKIEGPEFKDKGYVVEMQGEVRTMRESFVQFAGGLAIATVLVYLVMVAQFRSFVDPLIVLLTVPLGFIGVVLLLWLTGTNLSIMAFMGIIMMVGIVVEYSIVLVEFANQRVREGLSIREAILDAAKVRLRPILMTSLTTWLALLPMAFAFGGGEANAPLARAIIGGVIGATFLSLLVVPCLYLLMKRPSKEAPDLFDDPVAPAAASS
jgi:multidrug efflux pump subunit AcrB